MAALVSLALPAAAAPSRQFVFWPEVAVVAPGSSLYALPSVSALLYEQVGSERRLVLLPEGFRRNLMDAFKHSQSDVVFITALGTLKATVRSEVGPHNEPFVAYFIEKTVACMKALDSATEAGAFATFLMNPQGGYTDPADIINNGQKFKPTADKMLRAFQRDRCAASRNSYEPNALEQDQFRVIVRTFLLGERDLVHMTDADLLAANVVFTDLYFGRDGFWARSAATKLREQLELGMATLSHLQPDFLDARFETFIDFLIHHKHRAEDRVGDSDLKTLILACFDDPKELLYEFVLRDCINANRVVFHRITLSGATCDVAEDLP